MKQNNIHQTKYNIIIAFSLFIITLIGVFFYNNSFRVSPTEEVSHGAARISEATNLNLTPIRTLKADLKISDIIVTSECVLAGQYQGERKVFFTFEIDNIGLRASPAYSLLSPWYLYYAGVIPAGGHTVFGPIFWQYMPPNTYTRSWTLTPLNSQFNSTIPDNLRNNYIDRNLDADSTNNNFTKTFTLENCP